MNIFKSSRFVTRSLIGALGLSAIAIFGVPESAKAIDCGANFPSGSPGWVNDCPGGIDMFDSLLNFELELDLLGDDGIPETTVSLTASGPTKIWRGDGANGTIETEIFDLRLTGTSSDFGDFTIIAGDGIGNGLDDGRLHSFGAITQRTDDIGTPEDESALADSFFEVFFEIQGLPIGSLSNNGSLTPTRIRLDGDRGMALLGGAFPGSGPVGGQQGPVENGCTGDLFQYGTIVYCSTNDPVDVFTAGPDQMFGTQDDQREGITLNEAHIPTIPEPSTTLGLLFFGLGSVAGIKRKNKTQE
ncbi:MAG: PEP-CTERM sorting domain-containing protein [Okeania sp. SIO3B5]|uniref:PEP-CTERM sorting domain-containing protein n=1 Tax=Okeania sp. SIO3B5 TaxID=2607811 RepID=UPI00140002D9|nr:PEP-CTERM sorting domain-containing protein [Okeania sp. SIO3B5]NEO55722.1 PEP-CTERM sorting domain-containing protein [Okeania sp. SIO3B5]